MAEKRLKIQIKNEALELILLPGNSSEFEDSYASDELDFSQHGDVDYIPEERGLFEVQAASSSDDDSNDNIPLSELNETLGLILLPGSSSEFEDSYVSDELDCSQHGDVDHIPEESGLFEVQAASSSDDNSNDNIPLSELAKASVQEVSCSDDHDSDDSTDDQAAPSGKELTKAQADAKKYKWKKINVTVPENKFDGAFSDPPDKFHR